MGEKEYKHAATGSFCVYYGWDDASRDYVILVLQRGDRFKGTRSEGYGMPGGYIELETGFEQPRQAAVRELAEELVQPDGSPVLGGINPDRLRIVDSGIDYGAGQPGSLRAGVVWHGHRCELTPAELTVLKTHISRMETDPDYAREAYAASNNETAGARLVPAGELARSSLRFGYDHEGQVARQVAQLLAAQGPDAKSAPGFK